MNYNCAKKGNSKENLIMSNFLPLYNATISLKCGKNLVSYFCNKKQVSTWGQWGEGSAYQGCSPRGLGGVAPFAKLLEDFGGPTPLQMPSYWTCFKSFSTLLFICKLILIFVGNARIVPIGCGTLPGRIRLANQSNFKFLLKNLSHFIFTLREDVLSRNQATCQRILRPFGVNCNF